MRITRKVEDFARNEDGAIIVFFAVSLPLLLLIIGLVLDLGMVRLNGNRLQIAADSAALAGVVELKDDGDVAGKAIEYSSKNYPDPMGWPILVADDVITGHWDGSAFVPSGTPTDAVFVTTRRETRNNNPFASFFAVLAGVDDFHIRRSAVAHVGIRPICESGGFFSDEKVESGSNNDYLSDFCLYGKDGVKIGSDNSFGDGTVIGMNNLSDFDQGGMNAGAEEALVEMDEVLVLPDLVPGIVSGMKDSLDGMPPFITNGPVVLSEITDTTSLSPGTLYYVEEVADLGSDRTLTDIAIVAEKEVKLGSNNTLVNAVFATLDKILIGSNNYIGGTAPCAGGFFNVYLFSDSNIEYGSNNSIQGTQMGAGDQLKLGSDIAALSNVYGEARGKIDYGSSEEMGSCPGGLDSFFGRLVITEGDGNLTLVQ